MDDLQDPLTKTISSVIKLAIHVATTIRKFAPQANALKDTLGIITPSFVETAKLKEQLDHNPIEGNTLLGKIKEGKELLEKCSVINRIERYSYSKKLMKYNVSLLTFMHTVVQAMILKAGTEGLVLEKDTNLHVHRIHEMLQKTGSVAESSEREKYGWQVPPSPSGIVAFEGPLKALKAEIFAGIDDPTVIVVTAPGGCGKTSLVNMLCHDAEILEIFGENIFYVTVSETPNLMVIVSHLLYPTHPDPKLFQSKEDATVKLGIFLQKASDPMLIVLDDVWSAEFIEVFSPSKIRGHKIVVTSRTAFPRYKKPFRLELLMEEDAKTLFYSEAFPKDESRPSPTIKDELVTEVIQQCKRHPLVLKVVGGFLKGKAEVAWISMLHNLSEGELIVDIHKDVLSVLERSFKDLDDKLKQCFLDFGLFLEDQGISFNALLDMWMHLYRHDDTGALTMNTIHELSHRNLVDLTTTGNDSDARVHDYDQQFVTQHDLLRELAIHLNSKEDLPQRSKLIINAHGKDLPDNIQRVQGPVQARILSISTGESFSSKWCYMEVPNLEVLILNLMSQTYTLPPFLEGNQKLKILNIRNHGLYLTKFNNFHFLTSSQNLTRIRIECVKLSASGTSILTLKNLQKVSLIMFRMSNRFKKVIRDTPVIWPQLVELEIKYCGNLDKFPVKLCNSVHLKKISITNCYQLCEFRNAIGDLINLETLILRSCWRLKKLPDSICRLQKLSVLDISDCLRLSGLPEKMGELSGLRTIYMKGCTGVHELPESVEELSHVRVVCNEEVAYLWQKYSNVEIDLVEEN